MEKAIIFNTQKYNMYDGPGVRTLIFFQGCPLKCKWCSNPEGLEKKYRIMFKQNLCADCGKCVEICPVGKHKILNGVHKIDHKVDCIGCKKCEDMCMNSALRVVGMEKNTDELLEIIEEDRIFYEMSGGGVTLGGGEVLAQPKAAIELLKKCKEKGINTAIETSGYTSEGIIREVSKYTDLFLFDLKHMESAEHERWTGVRNEKILENLKILLEMGCSVKIRMPLLKGVNSRKEDIEKIITFLHPYKNMKNFQGVDLLPYHKMGVNKYIQLGIEYQIKEDPALKEEELKEIESWIKLSDLDVKIIRH